MDVRWFSVAILLYYIEIIVFIFELEPLREQSKAFPLNRLLSTPNLTRYPPLLLELLLSMVDRPHYILW